VGAVDELREAVEQAYPRYDEHAGDWDEVLRRAATAKPPRRSPWLLRGAIAAGAVAVAALFVVAPWRGAERVGVLDRALAAIGQRPALHVVVRDNLVSAGTLVDLETGKRKRVLGTKELWYDPNRGLVHEISRYGGVVEHEDVYRVANQTGEPLTVEIGGSSLEVTRFLENYRDALKAGRARVKGRGVVEGIRVYWITVRSSLGAMHSSGPNAPTPVEQVAVSRKTFKPVAMRTLQVGGPCKPACVTTNTRVLRMETLDSADADLAISPAAKRDKLASGAVAYRGPSKIAPAQAAEILGRTPVWLGRTHAGRPLAHVASLFFRVGSRPERPGLDFFYGKGSANRVPYVSFTETADREFAARIRSYGSSIRPGSRMGYVPPEGSVLVTRGRFGFLVRDGLYVRMEASGEKVLLGAARALRPLH